MKFERRDDKVLCWNLNGLLRDRNIRRPQDLRVMLGEYGLDMSYAACYALFYEQPSRVSLIVVETLMKMLRCSAGALFVMKRPVDPAAEEK